MVPDKIDGRFHCTQRLSENYPSKPSFQIVNDVHDLVAALTARLVTVKYGACASLYKATPEWSRVEEKLTEFNGRLAQIETDAVKAARLSDEINLFIKFVVDPLIDKQSDKRLLSTVSTVRAKAPG